MEFPKTIAIMNLENVVFFPHMLLPLHIFEPRYRQMLEKALAGNRMFAISDTAKNHPLSVGTLGLIRACIKNSDNTYNLLLQGITRVRFNTIFLAFSYYQACYELIGQHQPEDDQVARMLTNEILQIINNQQSHCPCRQIPQELLTANNGSPDYNALVDILAGNLIHCPQQKQTLLECEDITLRLSLLISSLRAEYTPF